MRSIAKTTARLGIAVAFTALLWTQAGRAQKREAALEFAPARTGVQFDLDASFHVVHGTFELDRGAIHFDPASHAISGEIVVNAASGRSGNDGRDRRMHGEILETARYPEIAFRPDHVEGTVEASGTSTVQVHGIFRIHGAEHELTIPVRVEMADDHWAATSHFVVPYVQWGIKNPSNLLLHVSPSVEVDVQASGPNPWAVSGSKLLDRTGNGRAHRRPLALAPLLWPTLWSRTRFEALVKQSSGSGLGALQSACSPKRAGVYLLQSRP